MLAAECHTFADMLSAVMLSVMLLLCWVLLSCMSLCWESFMQSVNFFIMQRGVFIIWLVSLC
jgi:hypothetical protein